MCLLEYFRQKRETLSCRERERRGGAHSGNWPDTSGRGLTHSSH
ncbi:hypothetical protein BSS2_I1726 [Brucella suis bv. 1 str. S2]|uniref:Uncharacterized protein n=5 Tax=Brucella TaxID=234 RepID=Q2YLF9_BRUA2|nr:hypothetical protein BR1783 [Brucella suis 1330]ABY40193.1 Hypothetical protein, conserved [Brucella suis ATCC 23445]ACO01509.1 Hypothetical protein, conserved [Brucella melitensis ATCC 23457]ACU48751.1 hypothetical protein BMI_I1801 [Brucella microti CCM 4915]AEK55076.1 hypothetical protein BPI_I1841 [Brucella pinnipedialis B2/94]AEU06767.1 hypothetical protein BSVBI22_A1779 [Brucella suis VBI22]AHN47375.1 hypothetical protein BSS2_I1726 [Brucella suis bv. 1 str. S2]CAJ11749.1 conserved 